MHLPIGTERQKEAKINYQEQFTERGFWRTRSNAIPKNKYCTPFILITTDLVSKEDIPKLQKGVTKLVKELHSHKFLGGSQSLEEINKAIEHMDTLLEYWYSTVNIGCFDFTKSKRLNQYIDYFNIHIKRINSSYLAVEFYIYFAKDYINSLESIIKSNHHDKKGYVKPHIKQNHKKSGAKRTTVLYHYNDTDLKSDLLFERITVLKWLFYTEIQKYIPILFRNEAIIPPSVIMYKTNISHSDDNLWAFWSSVGITKIYGQSINPNERAVFNFSTTERYEEYARNDIIFIYNNENYELKYYNTKDYEVVHTNKDWISALFCFLCLKTINLYTGQKIIKYRSKLNLIKLKKNKLKKLLRLRYEFEKEVDWFKRYTSDNIWEKTSSIAGERFEHKQSHYSINYADIIGNALASKEEVSEQIELLEKDFESKINVLQHLYDYKNVAKATAINLVMLVLTLLTVIFVVFPDFAETTVANKLFDIYNIIYNFISKLLFSY